MRLRVSPTSFAVAAQVSNEAGPITNNHPNFPRKCMELTAA